MHAQTSTPRTSLTSRESPALAPLERLMLLHQARRDARLSRAAVWCLMALDEHYNAAEGAAWPSQPRLAVELGSSRTRVCHSIAELTETGYISVERRGRGKQYRMLPPQPHLREVPVGIPLEVPAPAPVPVGIPGDASRGAGPDTSEVPAPAPRTREVNKGTGSTFSTPVPESVSDAAASAPPPQAKPPAVKPHRLPADWEPSTELLDWAVDVQKIPRPVVETQTANFKQYFWDNPRVCRPGWVGSFKTWMRNASKGGTRDAVTPWERSQRTSGQGNGVTTHINLSVPQAGSAFSYPTRQ